MRRIPIISTIVVVLAVATMIGLGLWQLLERRPAKLAYLERLEANPSRPPIPFPAQADEAVQLGTTRDPMAKPRWAGGPVAGYITHAPDGRSLIGAAMDPAPQRMMLVSATPLAGLTANAPPDLDAVPNSHLAYAGQWFFFAVIAAVIYVLAVRRRRG